MSSKLVNILIRFIPENNRIERIWKLAQVDFRGRYYNDRLGLLWALIKPVFEVIVYYFVFSIILQSEVDNYALFLFSGLIFWMYFSETTKGGIDLLKTKLYLIENIQFQRLDLFLSFSISTFFALIFNFVAYTLFSLASGVFYDVKLFMICIPLVCLYLMSFGVTLMLATLKPFLKDLQHLWDMILLAGFWGSGIFFSVELLESSDFAWTIPLNPMIGIMENIRACLLPNIMWNTQLMLSSAIYSVSIAILGYIVWRRLGYRAVEKL